MKTGTQDPWDIFQRLVWKEEVNKAAFAWAKGRRCSCDCPQCRKLMAAVKKALPLRFGPHGEKGKR